MSGASMQGGVLVGTLGSVFEGPGCVGAGVTLSWLHVLVSDQRSPAQE
jgi:hypothetical protein